MALVRLNRGARSGGFAAFVAVALAAGAIVGLTVPGSAWAVTSTSTPTPAPPTPDIKFVQYTYQVSFASGQVSATMTVTPVTPANTVFVIQTISIYRFPASASTLQTFLGVNGGFIALTDIKGTGDLYPAARDNLTAYVPAGQTAYVNMYRTGSPLPAESAYVTITGYLTAS